MAYQKTEQDKARNRERKKEWYRENQKEQYARVKRNQQRLKEWFLAFKGNLKCVRCGEDHPGVLDFHHRESEKKEANLCNIWLKGWSKERILKEVEKCDVLCANCHRKHHWDERQGRISPLSDKESKG